jgi:ElaB/YqjD/DUF883 family membrane-anchored ribosome-binding protein
MAQAHEMRNRRHNNGSIKHLREDVTSLQKDLSALTNDLGDLLTAQWNGIGKRVDGGVSYVGDQVRTHPLAAVGIAAGAGLLAGLAISLLNGRGR